MVDILWVEGIGVILLPLGLIIVQHVVSSFVDVSDREVLNQLVNLSCVFPIPDGDAKRHKVYTGSGNSSYTSSLGD